MWVKLGKLFQQSGFKANYYKEEMKFVEVCGLVVLILIQ